MQQEPGMTAERYLGARSSVTRLIDPGGMGRFRVLVLGRGIEPEVRLRGLQRIL
jgi:SAM-dependent MidA family methyltransferase